MEQRSSEPKWGKTKDLNGKYRNMSCVKLQALKKVEGLKTYSGKTKQMDDEYSTIVMLF
uniref:Uncharacterized protein n=1 Tax=Anguilla anguilla TaxID=7936 RepID=A0A0E9UHN8_ANGAN